VTSFQRWEISWLRLTPSCWLSTPKETRSYGTSREGAEDEWSESAVILQAQAVDEWLRIEGAGSHYVGIRPQNKLNDPKWPTESFPQLLKLAFGSRIISSVDHPAVKFILGITA
jgi:hypothetical protein